MQPPSHGGAEGHYSCYIATCQQMIVNIASALQFHRSTERADALIAAALVNNHRRLTKGKGGGELVDT